MKNLLTLAGAFALLVLFSAPALAGGEAVVKSLRGAASMAESVAATPEFLRARTKIPAGRLIETAEGALLTLELPGGHEVTLGPRATTARWSGETLRTVSMTIYRGQSAHRAARLSEGMQYRVVTPTAVAGVRGTEFSVAVAENGSVLTAVKKGEVATGDEEPEVPLGEGEEREARLIDKAPADGEEDWFAQNRVTSANEAAAVEAASAERMERTNKLTAQDLLQMAVLGRRVALFAARRPDQPGDVAEAAELLAQGITLFRRMGVRHESMEAGAHLTRGLGERHAIATSASESQLASYQSTRGEHQGNIDGFVTGLERLAVLVRTASAVSRPMGLPIRPRLPW